MKKFLKELITKNPIFILCLGLCSSLAVTTTFENGYLMGLSVLIVLIFSNSIVSLIGKYINNKIRIPVFIGIIAVLVTILEMTIKAYIPALSNSLGFYIPLIIVNCIILGRALSYASKHKVKESIIDAFKMGLGYTLALSVLGLIREVLGSNSITLMDKTSELTGYVAKYNIFPDNSIIPNPLFLTAAGAFLTLGLLMGIINACKGDDTK